MSPLFLLIFIGHLSLVSPTDPVTGKDISGRGQVIEEGAPFSPFSVIVKKNGVPQRGVPVEFLLIFGETKEKTQILTDSLGLAKFTPNPIGVTGKGYIIIRSEGSELMYPFSVVRRNLGWLILFQLIGGFTLFLFGLRRGGRGLMRIAGARMRRALWELADKPLFGALGGFISTLVLQSSTASTVMLVSFVNMGLIPLISALSAGLGAGVATTLTVQIFAFKVFDFAVFVIALGFLIERTKSRMRPIGRVIFGFGIVFLGIKIMSEGASGLSLYPWFPHIIENLSKNIFLGILVAFIFASLVHSSAATIAVILSLSFKGLISLNTALPLIVGANIGTGTTALIASFTGGEDGKRFAAINIIFKIFGGALFLLLLSQLQQLLEWGSSSIPRQIANAHTIFNILTLIIALPLLRYFVRLGDFIIKKRPSIKDTQPEKRLLDAPELAISFAHRRTLQMGDRVFFMLRESINFFKDRDPRFIYRLIDGDDEIDRIEEELTPFLTRLLEEELSPELSERLIAILYTIDEFEHIGDILSKSIAKFQERMYKEGLSFSQEGTEEIERFHKEVTDTLEMALAAFTSFDEKMGREVLKRKEEVKNMAKRLHMNHLERLRKGFKETLLTSTIHLDLVSDLERINFHAASIGEAILGE